MDKRLWPALGLVILVSGLFLLIALNKKARLEKPAPKEIAAERATSRVIPRLSSAKIARENKQESATQEFGRQDITESRGEEPAEKAKKNYFLAKPPEIKIEVEEGARAKGSFQLINPRDHALTFNIYKLSEDNSDIEAEVDSLISYKKEQLSKDGKGLDKAVLFTGAPWLIQFPLSGSVEAKKSASVQLTIDARALEAGERKTALVVLGSGEEEVLLVPVYAEVKKAPKIKLTRIEIDDGFSAGTKGNSNKAANPGEIVSLTMYFQNTGGAPAAGASVELSPIYQDASILNNGAIPIGYLAPQAETQARVLVKVNENSSSSVPPALEVTITDGDARHWAESVYAGEPGSFQYPGIVLKDRLDEK